MTENDTQQDRLNQLEKVAQTTLESGKNIHDEVKHITLKALSQGQLDVANIQQVIKAIVQGASQGAAGKTSPKQDLAEAIAGLDEALMKSAEASKLAIEEVAGHAKDFTHHDLKQALQNLSVLETMLIDTLKDVAQAASGTAKESLNELAEHARTTGTASGKMVVETVKDLTQKLQQSIGEEVIAGKDSALAITAKISEAGAGFLGGIAASLRAKSSQKKG
ncbi:MAG: hypothetical protein Q9N67_11135 [Ghiorsea sp.]|nr:hypothetical protein [Ghiorsea sp.]